VKTFEPRAELGVTGSLFFPVIPCDLRGHGSSSAAHHHIPQAVRHARINQIVIHIYTGFCAERLKGFTSAI
jgi:hypothetical protein